jgi:hypothetical protein
LSSVDQLGRKPLTGGFRWNYRIKTSAGLAHWTEIPNFASTGPTATLTNFIPPGATKLFVRARTPRRPRRIELNR